MTFQVIGLWALGLLDAFVLAIALNFGSPKVARIGLKRMLFVTLAIGGALLMNDPHLKGQLVLAIIMIISARFLYRKTYFESSISAVMTYILFCLSHLLSAIAFLSLYQQDVFDHLFSNSYTLQFFMIRNGIFIFGFLVYRLLLYTVKVNASSYYRGFSLLFIFNFTVAVMFLGLMNTIYRFYRINQYGLILIKNLNFFMLLGVTTFCALLCLIFYFINHFILTHYRFKEVQFKAEVDEMTGAFNRTTGLQMLQSKMRQYRAGDTDFTIAFVDVNNLKQVNDKYGHAEGDFMIQSIVHSIKDCLRDTDFIFRYGGDEFVVYFDDCYVEAVDVPWRRILNQLYRVNAQENKPYPITVSYGFAGFKPNKSLSVEELIEKADTEMYKNKKETKGKR